MSNFDLVIRSGEILLPGNNIAMKDIGLSPDVVYAGLAETIILALEGRFETYTVGSEPQWEKVREIYRLGLKHGMRLASIAGVNGVVSDEDIAQAIAARKHELGEKLIILGHHYQQDDAHQRHESPCHASSPP